MTTENKKYLVYGGVALLVGSLGYFIYNAVTSKPIVVKNATDDEVLDTTPTPAPKVNPFTALLGKKFEPITFKPIDYSVKNPFANTDTAIADNNPFKTNFVSNIKFA
jgi:hypothetical protein